VSGFRHGREVVAAVSEFSLRGESGKFLVVVGPSGCRETTLLRLIAGLEKQDSGHIYLDGVLVDDTPVGQLVQVGTVQGLIENPANEFVRDYLRS